MKTTTYNIRLDPVVKADAERTFAALGLNLSEAINVFLHKAVEAYGFPFDVRLTPNDRLRAAMREADAMLADPNLKTYATVEELNAALDAEDNTDDYAV
jgi:DNA-damage-inducible protein J